MSSLFVSFAITTRWLVSLCTAWKFRLPMLIPATWNAFTMAFSSSSPSMILGRPMSLMHSLHEYCYCSDILHSSLMSLWSKFVWGLYLVSLLDFSSFNDFLSLLTSSFSSYCSDIAEWYFASFARYSSNSFASSFCSY